MMQNFCIASFLRSTILVQRVKSPTIWKHGRLYFSAVQLCIVQMTLVRYFSKICGFSRMRVFWLSSWSPMKYLISIGLRQGWSRRKEEIPRFNFSIGFLSKIFKNFSKFPKTICISRPNTRKVNAWFLKFFWKLCKVMHFRNIRIQIFESFLKISKELTLASKRAKNKRRVY